MTLNAHERAEWTRCSSAARKAGLNGIAGDFDQALTLESLPLTRFDNLASTYRLWLCFGFASMLPLRPEQVNSPVAV